MIEKYISYSRAIKQEESMVIVSDQKVCIFLLHVKKSRNTIFSNILGWGEKLANSITYKFVVAIICY